MNKNLLYRSIPKVDVLLEDSAIQELTGRYGKETVMESVHIETDRLRAYIAKSENEEEARKEISLLVSRVENAHAQYADGRKRHRHDSSHESRAGADKRGAYEKGSLAGQRVFKSGVQSGRRKKRGALLPF